MFKSGKLNSYGLDDAYDLWFDELVVFGLSFTRNKADIEDAIQDVFVKLIDCKSEFENLKKLKAYIFVSVKHKIFNKVESNKLKSNYGQKNQFNIPNQISSIEDNIIESEIKKEVLNGYHQLPARCKEIFNLHLNGLSVKQISEELGLSENTIKTQKKIALRILRGRFSADIFVIIFLKKMISERKI